MAQAQSAICREGETFAIFLTLTLAEGGEAAATARRVAAELPKLTERLALSLDEPALASAIGFGAACWPRLWDGPRPAELVPFAPLDGGPRPIPATPADLFIHIHSLRHDANFALARAVTAGLGEAARLVEEVHGFQHLGGRDLTGFVDGTENPKGDERAEVALVGDEDSAFAGGSYVSVQRYIHDLAAWERLAVAEQEAVIGRTKADDIELDDAVKPATAHIARVVIEEDGAELQVVRHSLPYGATGECGLYFVAYGRSPAPFRRMLERMAIPDEHGDRDRLLDFARPVTGAAFFVPAVDALRR